MSAHCETLRPDEVNKAVADAMWDLFDRHYMGVEREQFEADFRGKDVVLLLWLDSQLIGFTSMAFKTVEGFRVVYSGDIIIAAKTRGIATIRLFKRWIQEVYGTCDWWCSLTSGVRTYRILHNFFSRVTPTASRDERPSEIRLRHAFATAAYGDAYNPGSGIVVLPHPYVQRIDSYPPRSEDPIDAFFLQSNPGWDRGDELVSLVDLQKENWKPAGMRLLHWKEP